MRFLMIFVFAACMSIAGCESEKTTTEEEAETLKLLREVKPNAEDDRQYNLFVLAEFYDSSLDSEQVREGVRQREEYKKLHDKLKLDHLNEITLKTNALNSEEAELLEVEEFPAYIVLDESGVTLQTSEVDEVIELVNKKQNEK
ncbi:hypothetical protein SAMN05192534_12811 [Alteribacillus persepolensis]|uniref:Uncharacterized protein n=1 Tax=Alteribacillus persepolensis TaxID=568899 RepID=A0A1G8J1T0_9BACI|nr:hypothetical protein [Alteribacillus persepolensis]SDI25013.1 hypothetical protein SAMN05192534_12811 [Alteribacillus persepolensis]